MRMIETALAVVTQEGLKIGGKTTDWSMNVLLGKVTNWVFIIAGIVAFFYLIYSGFIYLTAGGNPDAAKKGQQGILNAIIGVVIITLAYGIVTAIGGFF